MNEELIARLRAEARRRHKEVFGFPTDVPIEENDCWQAAAALSRSDMRPSAEAVSYANNFLADSFGGLSIGRSFFEDGKVLAREIRRLHEQAPAGSDLLPGLRAVAPFVLKAQEALVETPADTQEAYHWLYQIQALVPNYDPYNPWIGLRELEAQSAKNSSAPPAAPAPSALTEEEIEYLFMVFTEATKYQSNIRADRIRALCDAALAGVQQAKGAHRG